MSQTHVRIDEHRHVRMKEIAKKESCEIQKVYAEAIDAFIANKNQEIILADSKLERIIAERMNKGFDRIAAMLSNNNFDTSTILMGLMHSLSRELGKERNEIYQVFRKEALAYEQQKRKK